jgi:hypothetical protein
MKQWGARFAGTSVALAVAALSLSACSQPPADSPTSAAGGAGSLTNHGATAAGSAQAGAASTSAAPVAGTVGHEVADTAPRCSMVAGWNTAPDDGGLALSRAELTDVRVGRHACYDRVVFDVDGSDPVGFTATYVPVVRADGSGERVPVTGAAALEVVVRAPYLGTSDPLAWQGMPRVGDDLVAASQLSGWTALRGVVFAGSFEGQSTLAIGVREKRAFRMWTLESADRQRVILDIAH